jgi:hypothetical protein
MLNLDGVMYNTAAWNVLFSVAGVVLCLLTVSAGSLIAGGDPAAR